MNFVELATSLANSALLAWSAFKQGSSLVAAVRDKMPSANWAPIAGLVGLTSTGLVASHVNPFGGALSFLASIPFGGAFSLIGRRPNWRILSPNWHIFMGTPLSPDPLTQLSEGSITYTREGSAIQVRSSTPAYLTVQLPQGREEVPMNIILLPGASLILHAPSNRFLRLSRIEYCHPIVNQLATLRRAARLSARDTVVAEIRPNEAEAVAGCSPGIALRFAYALLSADSDLLTDVVLTRLDDAWSDTHVIRAEHLAHAGRYSEAFETTLRATQLGLPAFSFGLDLLSCRLSTYMMIARSKNPRAPEKQAVRALAREHSDQINRALDALHPFAAECDFDVELTTWRSQDPARMSGATIS